MKVFDTRNSLHQTFRMPRKASAEMKFLTSVDLSTPVQSLFKRLNGLTETERKIFRLRFGQNGEKTRSVEQIAMALNEHRDDVETMIYGIMDILGGVRKQKDTGDFPLE